MSHPYYPKKGFSNTLGITYLEKIIKSISPSKIEKNPIFYYP